MDWKETCARIPGLGRALLGAHRLGVGFGYLAPSLGRLISWVFTSRETTNFTYRLDPRNRDEFAHWLAFLCGRDPGGVIRLFDELEGDAELREHIRQGIRKSGQDHLADPEPRYGRRLVWYALVRMLRPRLVVETGVDKGLGSCVLAAALRRNSRDGFPGRYLGTEINPKAGYLLSGPYAEFGEIRYRDSLETLAELRGPVDLFISDSDHSLDYERREYEIMTSRLGPHGILVSDNAHAADTLMRYAEARGLAYLYHAERPAGHWYPGSGVGLAFAPPLKPFQSTPVPGLQDNQPR